MYDCEYVCTYIYIYIISTCKGLCMNIRTSQLGRDKPHETINFKWFPPKWCDFRIKPQGKDALRKLDANFEGVLIFVREG